VQFSVQPKQQVSPTSAPIATAFFRVRHTISRHEPAWNAGRNI
jgi:hypothetical protein